MKEISAKATKHNEAVADKASLSEHRELFRTCPAPSLDKKQAMEFFMAGDLSSKAICAQRS